MKNSGRVVSISICVILILSSLGMMNSTGQIYAADDSTYVLRVAMQDDVKTLNPLVAGDVWTWNMLEYLYESPIRSDSDTGELIPYIAVGSANLSTSQDIIGWDDCTIGSFGYSPREMWNNSTRSEAIIFYDFTGVKWHDGTQMSIRDVLFSYHLQAQLPDWVSSVKCLMDKGGYDDSNFTDTHYLHIQKVYESDDGLRAALKFELQTPFADFFRNTLSAFLLPYHIWGTTESGQPYDDMKIWLDDDYSPDHPKAWDSSIALSWDNPEPVGSGTFKFHSWNVGVSAKIETFMDHFYKEGWNPSYDPNGNAKQPTIEAMVFKIYKTAEQAVLALKNNDVDYIAWSIPPTFVQEIMNEPDLGVKQSAEKGFFYLGYNMRPERRSFGYDDDGEDIGKPLRQAIAHCIDKQTMVQRLLNNFGLVGKGPVSEVSEWYNESVPDYDFDPLLAKHILADAGYILEDGSTGQEAIDKAGPGNWWLNPDGSPIGNSEDGRIEILTPPADYDPIHAQPGLMFAKQMQNIGINADSIAMDFGRITSFIQDRDFDMYILAWRIGSDPQDFLHAFFHSDTAQDGQGYPGYSNESFDELIDLARETDDEDVRLKCILEAQSSIAYDLPYDVLYFKTNIEAYRSDRFVGWETGSSGSIYNWRSILNLRPPSGKWLNARFVNTVSAMGSNDTVDVEILVTGLYKNVDGTITREPIKDAFVQLNVTSGTLTADSGYTDSSGRFRTTFKAPYVPPTDEFKRNGSQIIIEIRSAELDDSYEYDPAPSKVTILTAYPEGVKFLSVQMDADPDVIDDKDSSGIPGMTTVEVSVFDQNNEPVSNASVVIQVDPKEPEVSPAILETDSEGKAQFTFRAIDIDEDKEYTVSVIAFKSGYKNGTQSIPISVVDATYNDPPAQALCPPDCVIFALLLTMVAIPICIIVGSVFFIKRRRSKP